MTLSDLIQKNSDRQAKAQWRRGKQRIHAWLAYIEETDEKVISDTLNRCETDPEAREYFIKRSAETPADCQPETTELTT